MRIAQQSGEVSNVKLVVSLIRCSSAGLLRLRVLQMSVLERIDWRVSWLTPAFSSYR